MIEVVTADPAASIRLRSSRLSYSTNAFQSVFSDNRSGCVPIGKEVK
jgi:hypothetical protein